MRDARMYLHLNYFAFVMNSNNGYDRRMGSMCARTICDAAVRDAENILFIYVFGCIRWNLLYVFIERVRTRCTSCREFMESRICARLQRAKVIAQQMVLSTTTTRVSQFAARLNARLVSDAFCDRIFRLTRGSQHRLFTYLNPLSSSMPLATMPFVLT